MLNDFEIDLGYFGGHVGIILGSKRIGVRCWCCGSQRGIQNWHENMCIYGFGAKSSNSENGWLERIAWIEWMDRMEWIK